MRELFDHVVNPVNDQLSVVAGDPRGAGGAPHRYTISGYDSSTNEDDPVGDHTDETVLLFQNGPIDDVGVNGITHEVLLAIVADRLRAFQQGPYSCKENSCALTKIEEAMHWLQARTLSRMRRGVEGSHTV